MERLPGYDNWKTDNGYSASDQRYEKILDLAYSMSDKEILEDLVKFRIIDDVDDYIEGNMFELWAEHIFHNED